MKYSWLYVSIPILLIAVYSPFQRNDRPAATESFSTSAEAPAPSEAVTESWLARVEDSIRESEYHVRRATGLANDDKPLMHAANRAKNLRAYFHADGVRIQERETDDPDWDVTWQFESWGRAGRMQKVGRVAPLADDNSNRVDFAYGGIKEWFINDDRGIEHGFDILRRPAGEGALILQGHFGGATTATNSIARDAVHFKTEEGDTPLQYSKLVAFDAEGTHLAATMGVIDGAMQYTIHDEDAIYPITVDPLFEPTAIGDWQAVGGSIGAQIGSHVSSAGDVNGDGYDDVLVGAISYVADIDPSETEQLSEGAAFVFLGSENGPVGNTIDDAHWVVYSGEYESFGMALFPTIFGVVNAAGDVNGDGFDDVIVGGRFMGTGSGAPSDQAQEGIAVVFHGSPTGLSGNLPADADAYLESNQVNASFGASVDGAGDVNGDGFDDIIVGAPGYDDGENDEGAAFIFLGSSTGIVGTDPTTAHATIQGDQLSATMGNFVAGAGDVNDDGYSDVLVLAKDWDNGQSNEGAVFVYHGSPSGIIATNPAGANATIETNTINANFNAVLDGAGDVNGDGYSDIIIGYSSFNGGDGAVYVYNGSASGINGTDLADFDWSIESEEAGVAFGISVAAAGDMNSDGFSDVIIGARTYENTETQEGAAFVYFGSDSGLVGTSIAEAELAFYSEQENTLLGNAVGGAGDTNGDGFSDVIIGAQIYDFNEANEGGAFVLFGAGRGLVGNDPTDAQSIGTGQFSAQLGEYLDGVGDVNGDGYADLGLGIPLYDNGQSDEGIALIFLGSADGIVGDGPANAHARIESNIASVHLGRGLAGAGDLNGDGYGDVLVGAHLINGTDGAVYIYYGSASGITGTTPLDADHTISPVLTGTQFGQVLDGLGDVNGDGYADIAIRYVDEVLIFHGSAAGITATDTDGADTVISASNTGGTFGADISAAGDVNGDGYSDIIIGANFYTNGEHQEGGAFLYYGSADGIVALSDADADIFESNFANAQFGRNAEGAGDVNGDGFDDIIIGASVFSNGEVTEGIAVVFHGSAQGVQGTGDPEVDGLSPATANALLEGNLQSGAFGDSVSSAGDVNADGYDDIIVGATSYDNPENLEGAAFLFLGSADGIVGRNPSEAAHLVDSNQTAARTAEEIGELGDVNGDGFSDVVVGVWGYDGTFAGEGLAMILYGSSNGVASRPRLETSGGGVLAAPGIQANTTDFNLLMRGHAPLDGKPRAIKLEWEVKPYGTPFDGQNTFVSSEWVDPGTSGHDFSEPFSITGDANGWNWRARVLYANLALFVDGSSPLTPRAGVTIPANPAHSRWYRPGWGTPGPSDVRTSSYLPPTPPGNLTITPANPMTADDLTCTIGLASNSDATPPQTIMYRYTWTNGIDTVEHTSAALEDTLDNGETIKGEVWTCTVTAFDSVQEVGIRPSASSGTIENTAPTAPTVSIISATDDNHGNSDNMTAQILSPSTDPDVAELTDTLVYRFEWYQNGSIRNDLTQDFSPQLSSQINFTELSPGDMWACRVTPADATGAQGPEGVSGEVTVLDGGATPSSVAAAVAPTSVTLGEVVTLSAEIFPNAGDLTSVTKRFDLTTPSGAKSSTSSTSEGGNQFSTVYLPTEASEGRAAWQTNGFWSGNNTYAAATSTAKAFTVLKATPEIELELSISSAPVGFADLTATATVSVPTFPIELQSLLSGLTINLFARTPEGASVGPVTGTTNGSGVVTFAPGDFTGAGVAPFDEPGTWQLIADFSGDDNFNAVTSTGFDEPGSTRLTIKDGAGYAIICVGKLDQNAEGQIEHTKTAENAYLSLRDRGLAHEDIYYLSEIAPTGDADIIVDDATPSQADLQTAIETWALGKMNATAAPLYLILLDHGLEEQFYIFSGGFGEERIVNPTELDGYMTSLQNNLTGDSADQKIIMIYGACNSGSFIPGVSGANRIIVTSAAGNEKSHRGPQDPDGVRDGELFVTELFRNLRVGKDIKEAFELASAKVDEFTKSSSSDAAGERTQTPLLDDNGDGIGSAADDLAFESGIDGSISFEATVGFGLNSGESIGWIEATQTTVLGPSDVLPELFARSQVPVPSGTEAWLEIKKPEYAGSSLADGGLADFQRFIDMPRFDYSAPGSTIGTGYFAWLGLDSEFTTPGTYKVFYYVKDGDTGDVSTHLLTTIFRQAAGNQAPPATTLLFPDDNATVNIASFYRWSEVTDPDDDPITYTIQFTSDSDFTTFDPVNNTGDFQIEDIVNTFTLVDGDDGIVDGVTYRWRVIPFDIFGNSPAVHEERTIIVDQDNSTVPGSLTGIVTDQLTGEVIAGATVDIGSGTRTSEGNGLYVFESLVAGNYSINASAPGFASTNAGSVTIKNGEVAVFNIKLESSTGFRWGDVTGDDSTSTDDSVEVLEWVTQLRESFSIDSSVVRPSFPPGADTNANSIVDVNDMSQIIRLRTGQISTLPADTNGDAFGPEAKSSASIHRKGDETRILSLVPSGMPGPGEALQVNVSLSDAATVAGFTISLSYDSSVLEYVSTVSPTLTQGWASATNDLVAGELIVSSGTVANAIPSGNGSILTLEFMVKQNAESLDSGLSFEGVQFFDITGGFITVQSEDGEILTGGGGNGTDVNGDGTVNAQDIQSVINAILGVGTPGTNADVNGDGTVNASDIQAVINSVLGINP